MKGAQQEDAAVACIKANPTSGLGTEMMLNVAIRLLSNMRHYDPHMFQPGGEIVTSWVNVGKRAVRMLGDLEIPHAVPGEVRSY